MIEKKMICDLLRKRGTFWVVLHPGKKLTSEKNIIHTVEHSGVSLVLRCWMTKLRFLLSFLKENVSLHQLVTLKSRVIKLWKGTMIQNMQHKYP